MEEGGLRIAVRNDAGFLYNEVAVEFKRSPEGFGYELKIPLQATGRRLYAIGAEAGSRIGLAVEVGGMPVAGRSPAAGDVRG